MDKRSMISNLQEKRAELRTKLDGILETAHKEERQKLTDDERTSFDTGETEIRGIDARITELDEQIRADEAAAEVAKRYAPKETEQRRSPADLSVTEPQVYRSGPGGTSYFRDLYLANRRGDREAVDRLRRNDKMVAETRAISTSAGAGGEFVPPLWLEDQFVALARPGRVTADLCVQGAVPPGTNSINIPKVLTGTAVAVQAGQNTNVSNVDMTTGSISSPVITIAGGQTISMQLVEQSPLNVDDLILGDLAADYATKLTKQVISGTGTGNQFTGLLTLAGTTAISWVAPTTGTPIPPPSLGGAGQMYSSLGAAISAIHTARFQSPTHIIMHPRRWAWAMAQYDTQGRPMVVPTTQNPMNSSGAPGSVAPQGHVGEMLGLPVFVDANIPTNIGGGTNQDVTIVARMPDVYLWEGSVRAEAFEQTFAQQLSLFVRLYNYASFQAGRYPVSIATVGGTGSVTPAF
jgi:HK97 family phage major capsid protein